MAKHLLVPIAAAASVVAAGLLAPAASADEQTFAPAPRTVTSGGKRYELVWSDEFNGTNLDPAWGDISTNKPYANGAMVYQNKFDPANPEKSNLVLKDGYLRLQARPLPEVEGKDASAGIQTAGHKTWKFGHYEARVRFHSAPGTWPALWMMPEENPYGWPRDGEIDWIEYPRSATPEQNQTVLHTSGATSTRYGGDSGSQAFSLKNGDLAGSWHTWAMDWTPEGFVFYMDGKEYGRKDTHGPEGSAQEKASGNIYGNKHWDSSWKNKENGSIHKDSPALAPFDKKFCLILNMGLKAPEDWAGRPKGTALDYQNAKIDVDYVRVYQTERQQRAQNGVYLKFDTRGEGANPDTRYLTVGQKVGELPKVKNSKGEEALEWYRTPTLEWGKVDANTEIKQDWTLFPKWGTPAETEKPKPAPSEQPNPAKTEKPKPAPEELAKPQGKVFSDVQASSPFASEIKWLKDQKVTTGWPDGTYRPFNKINRDAMAAYLYRLAGSPAYTPKKQVFKDVTPSNIFYKEISWAAERGITTGWDVRGHKEFRPWQPIDRNAMAAFLRRYVQTPEFRAKYPSSKALAMVADTADRHGLRDVKKGMAFADDIFWAYNSGVTTGWKEDQTFRPWQPIDRNAMAAFLYRMTISK